MAIITFRRKSSFRIRNCLHAGVYPSFIAFETHIFGNTLNRASYLIIRVLKAACPFCQFFKQGLYNFPPLKTIIKYKLLGFRLHSSYTGNRIMVLSVRNTLGPYGIIDIIRCIDPSVPPYQIGRVFSFVPLFCVIGEADYAVGYVSRTFFVLVAIV